MRWKRRIESRIEEKIWFFLWNWQLKRWFEHIGCTHGNTQKNQNSKIRIEEMERKQIAAYTQKQVTWKIDISFICIFVKYRYRNSRWYPHNKTAALHWMMSVIHQNKMKISSTSTDYDDDVCADDTMMPSRSLMLTKCDRIQAKSIDWGTVTVCTRLHCPAIKMKWNTHPTVTSKILLPTELDTAISPNPFRATITDVIKSGIDVPAARNVRPIT